MPYNGTGTYVPPSLPGTWSPASSGSVIDPTDWNTLLTDFTTAFTNVICKDGQSTVTADIPMAAHKFTGVSNASARTNFAAAGQIADNALTYAADSGSGTAYVITLAPAITAYVVGQRFTFKVATASTTSAPTLAVNGLTAGTIFWPNGSALAAGDLPINGLVEVVVATVSAGTPTYHLQSYMGRWRIYGTATPASSSTVDFISIPASVNHIFCAFELRPGTDAVSFFLQYYNSVGVLDTGSNYAFATFAWSGAGTTSVSPGTGTGISLTGSNVDNGTVGCGGDFTISGVQNTNSTKANWRVAYLDNAGTNAIGITGFGWRTTVGPITGVRFGVSSGSYSGKITLYVSE